MCDKLPRSVNKECDSFVETYGDAVIAILAQEIDPSQVCPMLSLCPKQDTKDIEILIQSNANDQRGKSNCPLCLFAVKQLEDMVKDQKTEVSFFYFIIIKMFSGAIFSCFNEICCKDFVYSI